MSRRLPSPATLLRRPITSTTLAILPRPIRPSPTPTPRVLPPAHRTMSDYEAFLNRANEDVSQPPSGGAGAARTASKKTQKVVTAEVPSGLAKAVEGQGLYYTSDADEPFEVVALEVKGEWKGDEASLASLIERPKDAVSSLSRKDFDPRGEYDAVFDAVEKAAGSGAAERVRVFRVDLDGTRAEYFVVAADADGARVVGLKAVAVES